MCSYNRINGTYACENSKSLNGLLKEELGFQGYVMSDWGMFNISELLNYIFGEADREFGSIALGSEHIHRNQC
jgi:beta-glucosidase-like glycosyl hydrolase